MSTLRPTPGSPPRRGVRFGLGLAALALGLAVTRSAAEPDWEIKLLPQPPQGQNYRVVLKGAIVPFTAEGPDVPVDDAGLRIEVDSADEARVTIAADTLTPAQPKKAAVKITFKDLATEANPIDVRATVKEAFHASRVIKTSPRFAAIVVRPKVAEAKVRNPVIDGKLFDKGSTIEFSADLKFEGEASPSSTTDDNDYGLTAQDFTWNLTIAGREVSPVPGKKNRFVLDRAGEAVAIATLDGSVVNPTSFQVYEKATGVTFKVGDKPVTDAATTYLNGVPTKVTIVPQGSNTAPGATWALENDVDKEFLELVGQQGTTEITLKALKAKEGLIPVSVTVGTAPAVRLNVKIDSSAPLSLEAQDILIGNPVEIKPKSTGLTGITRIDWKITSTTIAKFVPDNASEMIPGDTISTTSLEKAVKVQGVAEGTAQLSADVFVGDKKTTVGPVDIRPWLEITKVEIKNLAKTRFAVGERFKLEASTTSANAPLTDKRKKTWNSSNANVATVDADTGQVQCHSPGEFTLTVTIPAPAQAGKTVTATTPKIFVAVALEAVRSDPTNPGTVVVGTTFKLRFLLDTAGDLAQQAERPRVTVESSPDGIVQISGDAAASAIVQERSQLVVERTAVAKKRGTASVTATFSYADDPNSVRKVVVTVNVVTVSGFRPVKVNLDIMDDRTAGYLFGKKTTEDFHVMRVRILNNLGTGNEGKSILAYSESIEAAIGLEKRWDGGSRSEPIDKHAFVAPPLGTVAQIIDGMDRETVLLLREYRLKRLADATAADISEEDRPALRLIAVADPSLLTPEQMVLLAKYDLHLSETELRQKYPALKRRLQEFDLARAASATLRGPVGAIRREWPHVNLDVALSAIGYDRRRAFRDAQVKAVRINDPDDKGLLAAVLAFPVRTPEQQKLIACKSYLKRETLLANDENFRNRDAELDAAVDAVNELREIGPTLRPTCVVCRQPRSATGQCRVELVKSKVWQKVQNEEVMHFPSITQENPDNPLPTRILPKRFQPGQAGQEGADDDPNDKTKDRNLVEYESDPAVIDPRKYTDNPSLVRLAHRFRYRPYSYEMVVNTVDPRDLTTTRSVGFRIARFVGQLASFITSIPGLSGGPGTRQFGKTQFALDKYQSLLLPAAEELLPHMRDTERQNFVSMTMKPLEEIPFGADISRVLFFPKKPFRGFLRGHVVRISEIDTSYFNITVGIIDKVRDGDGN